ncbi:hypothetical protein [Thiobacillus sp.]|uniref:hypothetical protein n=1 Tax=Thiobacillus sp. TaxID=924 RepID=UPI0025E6AAD0|nr:hypothetical protein [Thiobacillus sp.]MBT9541330.1 hypothetical protein [Thiobacillus sp.]
MNQEKYQEYQALRQQVEKHPGFQYIESRRVHDNSLKIYGGNFKQLSGLLSFIENPGTYLRPEVDEKKRSELFSELHRHLHNYLAAAESLASHTRSYIKHRHSDDRIGSAYSDKVQEVFSGHVPTVLIKDFRNYFLHAGLPKSSIRESFNLDTREPPRIQVLLKVEELLKWKKWSSASKDFLRSQEKVLRLSQLVASYHNNLVSFYGWLDELLDVEHKEEVEELNALTAKVMAMEKARR